MSRLFNEALKYLKSQKVQNGYVDSDGDFNITLSDNKKIFKVSIYKFKLDYDNDHIPVKLSRINNVRLMRWARKACHANDRIQEHKQIKKIRALSEVKS